MPSRDRLCPKCHQRVYKRHGSFCPFCATSEFPLEEPQGKYRKDNTGSRVAMAYQQAPGVEMSSVHGYPTGMPPHGYGMTGMFPGWAPVMGGCPQMVPVPHYPMGLTPQMMHPQAQHVMHGVAPAGEEQRRAARTPSPSQSGKGRGVSPALGRGHREYEPSWEKKVSYSDMRGAPPGQNEWSEWGGKSEGKGGKGDWGSYGPNRGDQERDWRKGDSKSHEYDAWSHQPSHQSGKGQWPPVEKGGPGERTFFALQPSNYESPEWKSKSPEESSSAAWERGGQYKQGRQWKDDGWSEKKKGFAWNSKSTERESSRGGSYTSAPTATQTASTGEVSHDAGAKKEPKEKSSTSQLEADGYDRLQCVACRGVFSWSELRDVTQLGGNKKKGHKCCTACHPGYQERHIVNQLCDTVNGLAIALDQYPPKSWPQHQNATKPTKLHSDLITLVKTVHERLNLPLAPLVDSDGQAAAASASAKSAPATGDGGAPRQESSSGPGHHKKNKYGKKGKDSSSSGEEKKTWQKVGQSKKTGGAAIDEVGETDQSGEDQSAREDKADPPPE